MSSNTAATRRPRLAIVSTYDQLCGIAAYTKALVPQLESEFDIEVFDLDQQRLRTRFGACNRLPMRRSATSPGNFPNSIL